MGAAATEDGSGQVGCETRGRWRFVQHGADGEKFASSGEFREIVPGERIVSTFEYEAMPGHVILNTALFEEYEGKTKVTVSSVYQSVEDREGMLCAGMEIGANEAWDMLDELLTGEGKDGARPDLVLARELNAPRELVWKAWTDAKHLAQWWGPKGFTNPVCEVDVRPVGGILIHMRAPSVSDEGKIRGNRCAGAAGVFERSAG